MSTANLNNTAAAILGLLQRGPLSGWDVKAAAETFLGRFWNITSSQIYRELERLHERGLVNADEPGPRERRPYEVTAAGRRAFRAWLASEPGRESIRIPILLRLAFADELSDGVILLALKEHREDHQAVMASYEAKTKELRQGASRLAWITRYGVLHERAVLRWIDEVEHDIRERPMQRP